MYNKKKLIVIPNNHCFYGILPSCKMYIYIYIFINLYLCVTVHMCTYSIHVGSFHLDEFSIGISFHLDEFSFGQGAFTDELLLK